MLLFPFTQSSSFPLIKLIHHRHYSLYGHHYSLYGHPFLGSQAMTPVSLLFLLIHHLLLIVWTVNAGDGNFSFVFEGFTAADLNCTREAEITSSGLIQLTHDLQGEIGYAFYPIPIINNNKGNRSDPSSPSKFSTTFVFAIVTKYPTISGHGIAFAFTPTVAPNGQGGKNLGLFNLNSLSENVVAVEFDTFNNDEVDDISNNHVGLNVNRAVSFNSTDASYFDAGIGGFRNMTLTNGDRIQVWIDYDGEEISVTVAPFGVSKPVVPVMVSKFDLWANLSDEVYVGFSAATASGIASHYVLGWNFVLDGQLQPLDLTKLPPLPTSDGGNKKKITTLLAVAISLMVLLVVLLMVAGLLVYTKKRRRRFEEVLEDWEVQYGPQRLPYRVLYGATEGFKADYIIGGGGFGLVYKGLIKNNNESQEVAVKKFHHESKQGLKEFVAEIASMGRLRHRNLVQLLGYCRRRGELLLVYDYMPNGSLDTYLFATNDSTSALNWKQRYQIVKDVAAGLLYLHEGWEQVVVHRDIKAGNVLLDHEFNGKLSDFGLARLYDHGSNPRTTCVVGTFGYIAPELTKTGKATTRTDIYAFGCLLLEVVCGRRPVDSQSSVSDEKSDLVIWATNCWKKGVPLKVVDEKMRGEYDSSEAEKVLQLGLWCSHPDPNVRPSIRQVVEILEGDVPLPELSSRNFTDTSSSNFRRREEFDDFVGSSRHPGSEVVSESEIHRSSPVKSGWNYNGFATL